MDTSVTFIAFNGAQNICKNVSIIGSSSANKFMIDTTNGISLRGTQLFGIDGFLLANIELLAKVTDPNARSTICFDCNRIKSSLLYHAMNGKVINITTSDYPSVIHSHIIYDCIFY
eukprot:383693_1